MAPLWHHVKTFLRRVRVRNVVNSVSGENSSDVVKAVRELIGAFAFLAAGVYLTGGLALQLRLGSVRLPSSSVVPQLPREFLISVGLQIVAPAAVVGAIVWRIAGRTAGLIAFAAIYLVIGALLIAKDPFPATACLSDGRIDGVFIGETGGRTYLGAAASESPRRIFSIPQGQIKSVAIGGRPRQLRTNRCPPA